LVGFQITCLLYIWRKLLKGRLYPFRDFTINENEY